MIRIKFSDADKKALHHERFHHSHPITEACAQIAALTGIRRSPTQVSFFLKEHGGMKHRKTGVLPTKVDPLKQKEHMERSECDDPRVAVGPGVLSELARA